jgi:hypothetical protein
LALRPIATLILNSKFIQLKTFVSKKKEKKTNEKTTTICVALT